jgi:ubiquitin-protein ligase
MSNDLPSSESLFKDKSNSASLDQAREFQIMFEYEKISNYAPQGVFVLPDLHSIRLWHGVIFVRSGIYQGAVLKFLIEFPGNYPLGSPKVLFLNRVFHPLIDQETGELNLTPEFPSWRPKKDYIFLVLRYIKSVFVRNTFWNEEKYAKNKIAFSMVSNEAKYLQEVKKSIMENIEIRAQHNSLIKIGDFNLESKKILERVREIGNEENVKDFMDWLKSSREYS